MTAFSEMQLRGYEIVELNYSIDPGKSHPPPAGEEGIHLEFDYDLKVNNSDPYRFMLNLEFKLTPSSKALALNHIICKASGFFQFDKGTEPEKMYGLLGSSAITMLYSIMRTHIFQITAASRLKGYLIPTLNLKALHEQKALLAESKKKTKKIPAKAKKKPQKSQS